MVNQKLAQLKEQAKNYRNTLSVSMLVYTPFIVEVGALTVTTEHTADGKAIITLTNKAYPTEFTAKAVKVIKACEFKNASGKVEPRVMDRLDWYKEQLASTEDLITLMEAHPEIFKED